MALSVLGGGLGVALAVAILSGLKTVVPADGRGLPAIDIDGGVLAFVTALSVLCGLFFGMVPAASASRVDLATTMKAGGQRATSTRGARLRGSFIAAEVALAVVLAVSGLSQLWRSAVDPGFRPEHTPASCQARPACVALYDDLLRRVKEMGGVADVAAASALPLSGDQPLLPVEMEGHPLVDGVAPLLWAGAVTPSYFQVMHVPLLQGRTFDDSDGEGTGYVVMVSAATARRYWPGEDPVGKRIRVVWDRDWRTVVGVVGDVRQYALSGRAPAEITGALYMPYPQSVALNRQVPRAMALLARSQGDPSPVAARMRSLVTSVAPDVPVSEVRSLEGLVSTSVSEPRGMMWLFAAFAGCALLLAAIGTYGVVSYSTAQRTYEIGASPSARAAATSSPSSWDRASGWCRSGWPSGSRPPSSSAGRCRASSTACRRGTP